VSSLGRSAVWAERGVVATAHPLATSAGLDVLRRGGNAVDAILASAAVMGVAQPMMSGLGGDTFAVVRDGRDGSLTAVGGSGIAPSGLSVDRLASAGFRDAMPLEGMLSVAVPGAVDAAFVLLQRWGSGRFSMPELWAEAVRLARDGVPVHRFVAYRLARGEPRLRRHPSAARLLLPPAREGSRLRNPEYARTLETVAHGGPDVFYRGEVAEAIVRHSAASGGVLSLEDLAGHRSDVGAPLEVDYRGLRVCTNQPPSQGIILMEELLVASGWDLSSLGHLSAEAIDHLVLAKRCAFADRLAHAGDPRFVPDAWRCMLDPEHAAVRRRTLEGVGDTTYLCAADRDGNAVSLITSLSAPFGSAEVVEGTGMLLNNRAGRGFTLEEGHPNRLEPGKRTMHTLHAYMVVDGSGGLRLVGGTPGGDGQPQWNLQVLTALLDWGLGVQEAVEAPRWRAVPGTDPASVDEPAGVILEQGFPQAAADGLAARGHRVAFGPDEDDFGGAQVIAVDGAAGLMAAGSDPRVDGCAMGW
jgi:gamma-glutamyltranspeptidase/glutathione hydrolase